jgi:hypothetical protein
MPKPRSLSDKEVPASKTKKVASKPRRRLQFPKKEKKPKKEDSYPLWIAFLIASIPIGFALYVAAAGSLRPLGLLVVILASVCFAAYWRINGNANLRRIRTEAKGWKAEIMPKRLIHMSKKDFDPMRYELTGDDDDEVDKHEVRWASRYSRDVIFVAWVIVVLALGCLVCALLFPYVTIRGSGAQLPQTYNITLAWVAAAGLLLVWAASTRFSWDISRLMVTDEFMFDLMVYPAWLPGMSGVTRRIPRIRMAEVEEADYDQSGWGERWGHGTVVVIYQELFERKKLRLKRVPNPRAFCDMINANSSHGIRIDPTSLME